MTTVSPPRDLGNVKPPTADEQPRHERPWRAAFRLSAIVGWSAMVAFGVTAMVGEMFAAVTLLTISVSAFVAAGLAATFLPCPFTGYPFVTYADLAALRGDGPKASASSEHGLAA
jgi:hypothetical protein